MARFLNNKTLKDRVCTKTLLNNVNMLSVNQLNARIKIQEIWKTQNIKNYPIEIASQTVSEDRTNTRSNHEGRLIEVGKKA